MKQKHSLYFQKRSYKEENSKAEKGYSAVEADLQDISLYRNLYQEFERAWRSQPVYGRTLTTQRTRAVLESIEQHKRQDFNETEHLANNLTIEHIMPSNWIKNWPLPNGERPTEEQIEQAKYPNANGDQEAIVGQITRREGLLNTFGNLTLLTQPLNSKISNGSYRLKREALAKHSLLVLNREIVEHEEWGEEQIEQRGRELFKVACEIWPYPTMNTDS
ncbi:MAG: HNH endonuclease family protein [Pseudomonadota bacterium]